MNLDRGEWKVPISEPRRKEQFQYQKEGNKILHMGFLGEEGTKKICIPYMGEIIQSRDNC